ncbi:MAG: hypothetical protein H7329_02915 [Opitutaceae bacterium]|nr:hypothetical protein [Cytophagales bacterium]
MKILKLILIISCICGGCQQLKKNNTNTNDGVKLPENKNGISEPPLMVLVEDIENLSYNLKQDPVIFDTIDATTTTKVLNLKLDNGENLVFLNNDGVPYDENRASFKYIGRIDKINKFLVKGKFYEYSVYYIIDRKSGKKDSLYSMPLFSPECKYVAESYRDNETPNRYFFNIKKYNNEISKFYEGFITTPFKEQFWINDSTLIAVSNSIKGAKKYSVTNRNKVYQTNKEISKDWSGKYYIEIEGEKTSTEDSWKSYSFEINGAKAILKMDGSHAALLCDGQYNMENTDNELLLFYNGTDLDCKKEGPNFVIKRKNEEYLIKSENFNSEVDFLKLEKAK